MNTLKIYHVDAFTKECFKGNPAGVCMLEEELDDQYMQLIAQEMNLSETAFVSPLDGKSIAESNVFKLRWFAPKVEIGLCGHATLGASKILFDELGINGDCIFYETKSGRLTAKKLSQGIVLDFPIDEPVSMAPQIELMEAMGISDYENIIYGKRTNKLVIHLKTEEEVLNLNPNYEHMKEIHCSSIKGVGVTCRGNSGYDFISRYFNPWAGVNEDPVTGSVHTLLAAYWGSLLKRNELRAYQASYRGGEILLRIREQDRVELVGEAVIVLKGSICF